MLQNSNSFFSALSVVCLLSHANVERQREKKGEKKLTAKSVPFENQNTST